MYPIRKLKLDRSIGGLVPVLGMLAIFGLSTLIFGITVGLFTGAVMIWIYGLYCLFIFLRMGNFGHLILWVYMIFLGVMGVPASRYVESGWDPDINFMVAWISGVVFFGTLLIYAHDADRFYSHRRSGGVDGRMVAYLGRPLD